MVSEPRSTAGRPAPSDPPSAAGPLAPAADAAGAAPARYSRGGWWRRKFGPAFAGLAYAFRSQSSMWIHGFCGLGVVLAGFLFEITPLEFTVLIFSIGLVIACELLNTAVEHAVRLSVREYSPLAKRALDLMAGAVLWSALVACCIALIVFGPHLWVHWLSRWFG